MPGSRNSEQPPSGPLYARESDEPPALGTERGPGGASGPQTGADGLGHGDDETAQCWRNDPHQPHMWTWRPEDGGADCPGIPAVTDIVHDRPPLGSGLMPCCGRSFAETPGDRQTTNPELVTCGRGGACARCGHSEGEGCGCPPDASLRDRYCEEIIRLQRQTVEQGGSGLVAPGHIADAVLAVRDTELQQLRAALREVLDTFARVTSPPNPQVIGYQGAAIAPQDFERWRAALDPQEQP